MDQGFVDGRSEGRMVEWLLPALVLLVYGAFVWTVASRWLAEPERLTLLMLLITESITLLIVLFAKKAVLRDLSPLSVAATTYAIAFVVLFDYSSTTRYIPEGMGTVLQTGGLVVQITAKLILGRAFGLLPAVRGVVTRGPYRWVRHPIYLGYLIAHIGFLGANFSLQNLAVLMVLYAAQVWRMHREELALSTSPAYVTYKQNVRWRLIPGVY